MGNKQITVQHLFVIVIHPCRPCVEISFKEHLVLKDTCLEFWYWIPRQSKPVGKTCRFPQSSGIITNVAVHVSYIAVSLILVDSSVIKQMEATEWQNTHSNATCIASTLSCFKSLLEKFFWRSQLQISSKKVNFKRYLFETQRSMSFILIPPKTYHSFVV